MDAEQAMMQAKASIELEGFKIKPEYTALVKALLNKELTEEEFQRKIETAILKKGKQH